MSEIHIADGINATIIHPDWKDEVFKRFGLHFHLDPAISYQVAANLLRGEIKKEVAEAVDNFGFGIINTTIDGEKKMDREQWFLSPRNLKPSLHSDARGRHINALYLPEQQEIRKSKTGVSGRTKPMESMVKNRGHLKGRHRDKLAAKLEVLADGNKIYETSEEGEIGPGYFDIRGDLFFPNANEKFSEKVYGELDEKGVLHQHGWHHNQFFMMSGRSFHTRLPSRDPSAPYTRLYRCIVEY